MKRHIRPFLAVVAITLCVLMLPVLLAVIDYNTRYMIDGEVTPALSYRITGGLTLTDGEGQALLPLPTPTARAVSTLLPPWVRLTAALFDPLLDAVAALWDKVGTFTRP